MTSEQIQDLLTAFKSGQLSEQQAIQRLRRLPFERLEFATIDHHRSLRCGHPEVIFCPGKRPEHVVEIARRLSDTEQTVLATRASDEQIDAVRVAFAAPRINAVARTIIVNPPTPPEAPPEASPHPVVLICAGTADLPVTEEAAETLLAMNIPTVRLNDVGVSGLHRLLARVELLQNACVVIVVAGMEGALPSVVAGLVSCPVYAVPTSVGYGASFGGLAALLGMLNSCASNISVVNIDNGFGAAYGAGLIHKRLASAGANAKMLSKRQEALQSQP